MEPRRKTQCRPTRFKTEVIWKIEARKKQKGEMELIKDADLVEAQLLYEARIAAHLHKRGICVHNHILDQRHIVCMDCGKQWPNREIYEDERREIRATYF